VNFQSSANAAEVVISDITGRRMGTYNMLGNNVAVSTDGFAPGIYFYEVVNTNKVVVYRSKFEVIE
jgi:hypothetical protein